MRIVFSDFLQIFKCLSAGCVLEDQFGWTELLAHTFLPSRVLQVWVQFAVMLVALEKWLKCGALEKAPVPWRVSVSQISSQPLSLGKLDPHFKVHFFFLQCFPRFFSVPSSSAMFNLDLVFIVPFHSRVLSFQKRIIAEISELSKAIQPLFTQGFHPCSSLKTLRRLHFSPGFITT